MQDMQWEKKNLLEGFLCSMLFKRQSNPQGRERWSGMLMCLQFSLFLCEEIFCGWTQAQMCTLIQINSKPIKHPRRGYHALLELGVVIYLFRFITAIMNVFGDGEDNAKRSRLCNMADNSFVQKSVKSKNEFQMPGALRATSLTVQFIPGWQTFALLIVSLRSRLKERAQRLRGKKKHWIMKCCAPRVGHRTKLALNLDAPSHCTSYFL